jgi:hypothetical protein
MVSMRKARFKVLMRKARVSRFNAQSAVSRFKVQSAMSDKLQATSDKMVQGAKSAVPPLFLLQRQKINKNL